MLRPIRIIRLSRRLTRNRSGATAVEFAIIAVALLSFIAFLVEGSFQLLTSAMLQYGLREATRFGITGQPYPSGMSANPPASREAAIRQVILSSTAGLINPSYLMITLTTYPSFADVGVAGKDVAGAGGAGSIVRYEIDYYQPWLLTGAGYFPIMATGLSAIEHTATAVVQNENFLSN